MIAEELNVVSAPPNDREKYLSRLFGDSAQWDDSHRKVSRRWIGGLEAKGETEFDAGTFVFPHLNTLKLHREHSELVHKVALYVSWKFAELKGKYEHYDNVVTWQDFCWHYEKFGRHAHSPTSLTPATITMRNNSLAAVEEDKNRTRRY